MKRLLLPLILVTIQCIAQTSAPVTGNAKTEATCSAANTGNQNHFIINCGIGQEQGKQMIAILNKVLANQLDPTAVMAKLDEILKGINPNLGVKTYNCYGRWTIVEPGATAAFNVVGGDNFDDYKEMVRLNSISAFRELASKCDALRTSNPEWLTPRLFCSLAYGHLGDLAKAKVLLDEYDSRVGPAYKVGDCLSLSDYLHSNLKVVK